MPTVEQLQQMATWLAGTDIGLLELRTPQGMVRLGRTGAATGEIVALAEPSQPEVEALPGPAPIVATASSVGVFLHGHPTGDASLVQVGERVTAGQAVGLLRIGPLLLPVSAPLAGQVTAVRQGSGRAVGYGAALVELRAD